MEKQTLNTDQIREATGLGRDYVRALVRQGKLPNVGPDRRILVPRSALERFLNGEAQAAGK